MGQMPQQIYICLFYNRKWFSNINTSIVTPIFQTDLEVAVGTVVLPQALR